MKRLENYFSDAKGEANENFYSANGFDDDFDDDFGFMDDEFDYAVGGGQQAAPTSQPYIINVTNTDTNTDISNVTILGAYTNLSNSAPAYGNTAGIELTMGIAGITYSEFLYQSMNKPFQVGLMYISDSVQTSNVLETFSVTQKDVNGNVATKVLTPTIDPYQNIADKVAFKFAYGVDGFTSIVISQILRATASANNVLKLYIYPAETVSTSRALAGKRAVRGYGNPKVVKGDSVTLSRSAVRALRGR